MDDINDVAYHWFPQLPIFDGVKSLKTKSRKKDGN